MEIVSGLLRDSKHNEQKDIHLVTVHAFLFELLSFSSSIFFAMKSTQHQTCRRLQHNITYNIMRIKWIV